MTRAHELRWLLPLVLLLAGPLFRVVAQDLPGSQLEAALQAQPQEEPQVAAPQQVDVEPLARDEEIAERLERILVATDWFQQPQVRADEGVVFLSGTAEREEYRKWAGDLARNTQDVVAVVNQLEVAEGPIWDLQPALAGLEDLEREAVRWLPFIVLALAILAVALVAAWLAAGSSRSLLRRRVETPLLREVIARAIGAAVFLFGLYVVLRVSGLTRLALTVIGGTGLLGLVISIAFRDITENFLASIFLSRQRPFRTGDLVEIEGVLGYIQRLTVRTTVLMTLDGNHVQIPNATVYKSTIRNFTSNPNRREQFTVGIGYEVPIARAQEIALAAIAQHPAVLKTPEPWVLADSLGSSTVNLRVYFWLNGTEHSWLKVRSSVIRLVKRTFQDAGISMPDEAREIVFPRGVPIAMVDGKPPPRPDGASHPAERPAPPRAPSEPVSTDAEAGLSTEAGEIEDQARRARSPEEGENLLTAH